MPLIILPTLAPCAFEEGFESGNLSGYYVSPPNPIVVGQIVTNPVYSGTYALSMRNGSTDVGGLLGAGVVRRNLGSINPTQVSWRFRIVATLGLDDGPYFSLGDLTSSKIFALIPFREQSSDPTRRFAYPSGAVLHSTLLTNTWYHAMVTIDWSGKTTDLLLLDNVGSTVANLVGVAFNNPAATDCDTLTFGTQFTGDATSTVVYDEISIC